MANTYHYHFGYNNIFATHAFGRKTIPLLCIQRKNIFKYKYYESFKIHHYFRIHQSTTRFRVNRMLLCDAMTDREPELVVSETDVYK